MTGRLNAIKMSILLKLIKIPARFVCMCVHVKYDQVDSKIYLEILRAKKDNLEGQLEARHRWGKMYLKYRISYKGLCIKK